MKKNYLSALLLLFFAAGTLSAQTVLNDDYSDPTPWTQVGSSGFPEPIP